MGLKKRYIILAWIGLEIAALPVAALGFKSMDFNFDRLKITTAIPVIEQAGHTSFIVTSQGPFAITTQGLSGNYNVKIYTSGFVNGNPYGENARLPGAKFKCGRVEGSQPSAIYMSEHNTSVIKGPILSRAVRVDVTYDPNQMAEIDVVAHWKANDVPLAQPCERSALSRSAEKVSKSSSDASLLH